MTLKQQLKDCHLSQGEAASLIGVSKRSVERWAANDSAPEILIKALRGYKLQIDILREITSNKARKST